MIRRFRIALGLLTVGFAAVLVRLAYLQVWCHADLSARAAQQAQRWVREAPRRAAILDRHGAPLAESVASASCYADPTLLAHPNTIAARLGAALDLNPASLARQLKDARGSFVWVRRQLTPEQASAVEKANLRGVGLVWDYRRFYPNGDLAAPLLGRVGDDGRGLSGLEYAFNENLLDHRPARRALRDGKGRRLALDSIDAAGDDGRGLRLSLDRTLQYIAERELDMGVRRSRAKGGAVVIQDVRTGEILALAGRPRFSFSNPTSDLEDLQVRATQWVFEPGSTFKLITAAAAMEQGRVRSDEMFNCEGGSWKVAGVEINDHEPERVIPFARVMAVSSNIGFAKLGLRLGKESLYDYTRAFGFGTRTGCELPGESPGLLRPPARWSGTSLPILSFGQEIGVTALQMAGAYTAVANGGLLLEPRLCLEAQWPGGGRQRWPLPGVVRRVIRPETASALTRVLEGVVTLGTGQEAAVPGWTVAGKTGTAQKIDPATRAYSRDKNVASFCGFVPANRPRLTIVVILDEPAGVTWGGYTAGPVFRNIAAQAMMRLAVPTDQPPRLVGAPDKGRGHT
jgi:cell division protein FtsI (penicillin-binding protein 3)